MRYAEANKLKPDCIKMHHIAHRIPRSFSGWYPGPVLARALAPRPDLIRDLEEGKVATLLPSQQYNKQWNDIAQATLPPAWV